MNAFAKLMIFVLGAGFVLVAIQGAMRGWLPTGPQGFEESKGVKRDEKPIMFWFFFALYVATGGYVVLYVLNN